MGKEPQDMIPALPAQGEAQAGPSWANPRWPLADDAPDLDTAMDPTDMVAVVKEAAAKAGKPTDSASVEEACRNSIQAMLLIRLYRVRGHLAADLDPLGLSNREVPGDLSLEWHGFAGNEDTEVFVGGAFGFEWVTVRDLYAALRLTYCGNVGLEYMHIADTEERRFLQDKFESPEDTIQFTPEGKQAILQAVIRGEEYEKYLAKKYVGTKRFGLDGGEAMIPALEAIIKYGGADGVREIIYGMAHRGRLNVLANVMAKPYKIIFHEFSGGSANPDDVGGSGDVKYHLGTSTDREFDGTSVHMSLVPNPSHLEAVNPVVLGKARAQQAMHDDLNQHQKVLPVLIHGDAAFAGQGVVWESLSLSGVPGYDTGGCIHFIINNQIGFTTSPKFARSSPYPSDVAKGVQAPILHVNGDDPEAVTFACKLAIEYRMRFGRDVVIDMWCYRRFGHNEGDEPSFTQPLMYQEIRKHPRISELYTKRLEAEG
ncbi:MAG: thiamine pyrophosphate-dependent enzyme, partial [Alteraurantiacibacter sp.]